MNMQQRLVDEERVEQETQRKISLKKNISPWENITNQLIVWVGLLMENCEIVKRIKKIH